MERWLVLIGAAAFATAACGTEPSTGAGHVECVPSLSEGPCNASDQVACIACDPDAGTLIGVQECDQDGGGYGPCRE